MTPFNTLAIGSCFFRLNSQVSKTGELSIEIGFMLRVARPLLAELLQVLAATRPASTWPAENDLGSSVDAAALYNMRGQRACCAIMLWVTLCVVQLKCLVLHFTDMVAGY